MLRSLFNSPFNSQHEGAIISMPMRTAGNSKWKSFIIGSLSGAVEPAGAIAVLLLASLLMSSYSPGVYDGATAEFRDICNYWKVEKMGTVTAKLEEQKTDETKQKILELAGRL